jgi:hypothetical protein
MFMKPAADVEQGAFLMCDDIMPFLREAGLSAAADFRSDDGQWVDVVYWNSWEEGISGRFDHEFPGRTAVGRGGCRFQMFQW